MAHKFHLDNNFSQNLKYFGDISLMQIGIMHCAAGDVIGAHMHGSYFELTAVLDGEGEVYANNDKTVVKSEDIFVSGPFETHNIVSDTENPLKFIFCAFNCTDPEISKELLNLAEKFRTPYPRVIRSGALTGQLELALNKITDTEAPLYGKIMHTLLTEIILLTLAGMTNNESVPHVVSKAEEFCYQVMAYINRNVTDLSSLRDLSSVFSYDYFYISKTFRRVTGQTLSEYYTGVRLRTAKMYIEKGYMFSDVAEILNYSSIYAFSKSFKKQFGITPSEYRRERKS